MRDPIVAPFNFVGVEGGVAVVEGVEEPRAAVEGVEEPRATVGAEKDGAAVGLGEMSVRANGVEAWLVGRILRS